MMCFKNTQILGVQGVLRMAACYDTGRAVPCASLIGLCIVTVSACGDEHAHRARTPTATARSQDTPTFTATVESTSTSLPANTPTASPTNTGIGYRLAAGSTIIMSPNPPMSGPIVEEPLEGSFFLLPTIIPDLFAISRIEFSSEHYHIVGIVLDEAMDDCPPVLASSSVEGCADVGISPLPRRIISASMKVNIGSDSLVLAGIGPFNGLLMLSAELCEHPDTRTATCEGTRIGAQSGYALTIHATQVQ